ncbi:E3 ubiquitin-protein ligase RNF4-like [Amphiura filiformis]|uniref:E3 ubiquitin-protein ligase RNF4-like n=1 Tax=Amphiura filiformis TaxID=82378 RepID=UPI003B214918
MSRKLLSKRYKTEQQAVNKRRRMMDRRDSETDVLVTAITHPREDEIEVLGSSPAVVDLTVDLTSTSSTPPHNEVVDLTESFTESPVILDLSVATRRSRRQRNNNHVMRPSQRDNILFIDHSDDSDEEVQELPPSSPYNTRSAPHRTEALASSNSAPSGDPSTPKRVITCPVCMEDERTIHASGQHLTSTTCGHVFCNQCIRAAIATQHKCPTCRKRLTIKQIHQIFL